MEVNLLFLIIKANYQLEPKKNRRKKNEWKICYASSHIYLGLSQTRREDLD